MSLRALLTISCFLVLAPILPAETVPSTPVKSALDLQQESLAKQRASLNQQSGADFSNGDFQSKFFTSLPPPVYYDCSALTPAEVKALIDESAKEYAVSAKLIRAVMKQESNFQPCAVSYKGAQGLMQLMPSTANLLKVDDPFDPRQNTRAGTRFLKRMLDRFKGDLRLALVAYNAGSLTAEQIPASAYPAETQGYLASIFAELGIAATTPNTN